MKSNLMRAIVFTVLGIALLVVSLFTKNPVTEKWSSFAFGASMPMFVGGIVSIVKYLRQPKEEVQAN